MSNVEKQLLGDWACELTVEDLALVGGGYGQLIDAYGNPVFDCYGNPVMASWD